MLTIVPGLFFPAPSQSCQFGCYEVRKSAFGPPTSDLILIAIRERHSPRVLFSARSLVLENAP